MRGAARLYKTVNGGAMWVPILYYEINAAAIDPGTSATVYAASHVLLFKSLDGGGTWTQIFREPQSTFWFTTSGGCGPIACSVRVVSNEPFNGTGDGDTEPDFRVVDARTVELRAERSPADSGRIYTLRVAYSDSTGQLGGTSRGRHGARDA